MSDSGLFAEIIEKLITGSVLCEVAHEAEYQYLLVPAKFQDVDSYLERMNRRLRQTQDNLAFYCAYKHLDKGDYRHRVRAEFGMVVNDLDPLVRWLNLCLALDKNARPLTLGTQVKESQLLAAIEHSNAITDELAKLSHSSLLRNTQTSAKGQLSAILRKLCEHGYLIANSSRGSQYTATGKWSRLYELMAFISSHEQLESTNSSEQQEMLV